MKKIILLSSVLCVLGAYSANAQISVTLGEPVYAEPGYVVAPDWPSNHYDIHRHRHNDYWGGRDQKVHDQKGHDDHGHR